MTTSDPPPTGQLAATTDHLYIDIPDEITIITLCLYCPLIVAILFTNSLVMLAVYTDKTLRIKSNYFILNLSVADFLTGLVGVPVTIIGRLVRTEVTCYAATRMAFFTAAFTFSAVSLFQLLAITIERYMAVIMPLLYHKVMTPARYVYTIALVWILGVVFGIIPNLGSHNSDDSACAAGYVASDAVTIFMLTFAIGIPAVLLAMGLMYFHIFRKARIHSNRIAALRRATIRTEDHQRTAQDQEHKAQMKATKTTAIILGGFAVCWIPIAVKFFLEVFLVMDPYTVFILQIVFEFPAYANSAINPVIYSYRNAEFRTAVCKILAMCCVCLRTTRTKPTAVVPFTCSHSQS